MGTASFNIDNVLFRQGKLGEALTHQQRALSILEETMGPRDPLVAYVLVGIASSELSQGHLEAAREPARRAVSIREELGGDPLLLAHARFVLAGSLWSDRSQRARARALAEQARGVYAHDGTSEGEHYLAETEQWIATHRVR